MTMLCTTSLKAKRFERSVAAAIVATFAGFLSGCAMDATADAEEDGAAMIADESGRHVGGQISEATTPSIEEAAQGAPDEAIENAGLKRPIAQDSGPQAGFGEACGQYMPSGAPAPTCKEGLRCELGDDGLPDLGGACALDGPWKSPSCGGRTYERQLSFLPGGKLHVRDLVSPCPPKEVCVWSGILDYEGTYTVLGDAITLTVPEPPKGLPVPSSLTIDRATEALIEAADGETCAYQAD